MAATVAVCCLACIPFINALVADNRDLRALLDRIDDQIGGSLAKINKFPPKPAGFPDRVDALCDAAENAFVLVQDVVECTDFQHRFWHDYRERHPDILPYVMRRRSVLARVHRLIPNMPPKKEPTKWSSNTFPTTN